MTNEELKEELVEIKERLFLLERIVQKIEQENIKDEDIKKISRWNNLPKLKDLKS